MSFVERLSLFRNVHYQRFYCICEFTHLTPHLCPCCLHMVCACRLYNTSHVLLWYDFVITAYVCDVVEPGDDSGPY